MDEKSGMKAYLPPSKQEKEARLYRFSRIFFSMAITCLVLVVLALLSSVLAPVLYFLGLMILGLVFVILAIVFAIFTFGLIFAIPDNPVSVLANFIGDFAESGGNLYNVLLACWYAGLCISVAGILASVLGIVFVALSKGKAKAFKLVFLSILIAVFGGILAFQLFAGGV